VWALVFFWDNGTTKASLTATTKSSKERAVSFMIAGMWLVFERVKQHKMWKKWEVQYTKIVVCRIFFSEASSKCANATTAESGLLVGL
jgi:hypothetical protein